MRSLLLIIQTVGLTSFTLLTTIALLLDPPIEFYNNKINGNMSIISTNYTIDYGNDFNSLVESFCKLSSQYSQGRGIILFPQFGNMCNEKIITDYVTVIRVGVIVFCFLWFTISMIIHLFLEISNGNAKRFTATLVILSLFLLFNVTLGLLYFNYLSSVQITESVILNAGNITFEVNNTYRHCTYTSTMQFKKCYCGILNIRTINTMHMLLPVLKDSCITTINTYSITLLVCGIAIAICYIFYMITHNNDENIKKVIIQ